MSIKDSSNTNTPHLNDTISRNCLAKKILATSVALCLSTVANAGLDENSSADLIFSATLNPPLTASQVCLQSSPATIPPIFDCQPRGVVNGEGIASGDLDSDGDVDIILGGISPVSDPGTKPQKCLNQFVETGTVTYQCSEIALAFSGGENIGIADLNNDNNLDVIFLSEGNTQYCFGDGAGNFTSCQTITPQVFRGLAVAIKDLNGDGLNDFAIARFGEPDTYCLNNISSPGSFSCFDIDTSLDLSRGIAAGDVDGDGDNDLVIARSNFNEVCLNTTIAPPNGTSDQFVCSNIADTNQFSNAAAVADLDKDGNLDAVFANSGSTPFSKVCWGIGDGTFVSPCGDIGQTNSESQDIKIGDMNNDGNLDIVIANSSLFIGTNSNSQICYNQTNRQFDCRNANVNQLYATGVVIIPSAGGPPVQNIAIDIRPYIKSGKPNFINLKSKGKVPVVILSSEDFNPADVDRSTINFAGAAVSENRKGKLRCYLWFDLNKDKIKDLICRFEIQELTDLQNNPEATSATLKGKTNAGQEFEGTDSVKLKFKHKHHK